MSDKTEIKCPNCGTSIDVQDVISHQLEEDFKKKYNAQLAKEKKKYDADLEQLERQKADFEKKKLKENKLFQERFDAKLKEEKLAMEKQLKAKLMEEQSDQMTLIQKELSEKSEQVKELNKTKGEIEKLKREKDELKEAIEAEAQKNLTLKLNEEKEKIKKFEHDKSELVIKELQKQLDDQKKLTEEMTRKQEQGSIQLQGEIQELAIEEWIKNNFPFDTLEEIKKGARGADCLQIINTPGRQDCGSIYYESKRTKDFQSTWIEKFKADMRSKNATFGVLVTEALPKGIERLSQRDGIWICTFEEFKALCFVLRESAILISQAVLTQENKGEKMSLLYDFLTGSEFKMQVEAIVEGFTQMQTDLDSERRAMEGLWKKREKQIQKVLLNTTHMYSAIKGIAGNAVGAIKALELPPGEEI
ncbi:MAG: DUF2130 domain-containing protein [Bacteroidia bacterium]|jgi:hypothetical protein